MINESKHYKPHITDAMEIMKMTIRRRDGEHHHNAIKSNLRSLDDVIVGFKCGKIYEVYGVAGSGKSQLWYVIKSCYATGMQLTSFCVNAACNCVTVSGIRIRTT